MKLIGQRICLALILFSVALSGTTQARDIYRWTADDGTVTYGSSPPIGVEAERVGRATGGSPPSTPPSGSDADTDDNPETASDDERSAAQQDALAQECARVRENLAVLQSPATRRIRSGDGEAEPLTEERRAALLEENQSFMDEWCQSEGLTQGQN